MKKTIDWHKPVKTNIETGALFSRLNNPNECLTEKEVLQIMDDLSRYKLALDMALLSINVAEGNCIEFGVKQYLSDKFIQISNMVKE